MQVSLVLTSLMSMQVCTMQATKSSAVFNHSAKNLVPNESYHAQIISVPVCMAAN